MLAMTVHTAGINWASVGAIVGTVATTMTIIVGISAKLVANQISSAIDKFRIEVVSKLDTRITRIETILNRNLNRKLRP
jgi:hypothetical protein